MSFFTGIENAKTSEKLPNITPGKYLLEVDAIKAFTTRSKGPAFVAEFKVVESEGEGANPVGTRCSFYVKLSLDSALGNIKGLAAALQDIDTKSVTQAMVDKITTTDQNPKPSPAIGTKVYADAFVIKTKEKKDFTLVQFSPYRNVSATAAPVSGETSSTKAKGK